MNTFALYVNIKVFVGGIRMKKIDIMIQLAYKTSKLKALGLPAYYSEQKILTKKELMDIYYKVK